LSSNDLIARCTVRSLALVFRTKVAIEGQHSPASFAQSASAIMTNFSVTGRSMSQTIVM